MIKSNYQVPWYLRQGLVHTLWASKRYGKRWEEQGEQAAWLRRFPPMIWREKVFTGADDVPLWGVWSCPPRAKGTLIITYGITGTVEQAWYAQTLARKAYEQGWAVLLYDWRFHGKTAELSGVPCSDGWREGWDQVRLAEQLVELGCPPFVGLVGFSLGGQLALWGLKAAEWEKSRLIGFGAVLCPALESNRSLTWLQTTWVGRRIERVLTEELRAFVAQQCGFHGRGGASLPEHLSPDVVNRIDSIMGFDREIVINYYGFPSVRDYYEQTSGLYLLDQIRQPYLVIYAADDPMFEPDLVPEIEARMAGHPDGTLLLTTHGGHLGHLTDPTPQEDEFWGLNRLLEFSQHQWEQQVGQRGLLHQLTVNS
ncbi:YheT family hydrolase [Spirulina subsalsa]|uniref:YheT family hydrolase n=1 Tax=Spirulina subsalsa TaxID=54311 RepID=UPI000307FCFC|nr:alpha/beta fold hydrolase [Spirulina subsalsa]